MNDGIPTEGANPDAAEYDPGLDVDVLRRRRDRALTLLAIAAILAITGAAAFFALRPRPVDRRVVVGAVETAVRDAIGTAYTVTFGEADQAEGQSAEEYVVRGEAVAVNNATLASTHYWYECEVHRHPDGNWLPARLTLTPQ